MALLLQPPRLSVALHRPGAAQTRKLALPAKFSAPRITISVPRLPFAATVEAPTAPQPASVRRPALYLLHRHLPRSTDGQDGSASQQHLHQLHDDLKVMEKVAKRAAWFSTIEASDGEHVLLLTDCAKLGRKYGLQTMPADASSFTLDLPGRSVVVPLAEISTGMQGHKRAEHSQDDEEASSDEEDPMAVAGGQVAVTEKEAQKAAKKMRKEGAKAEKKAKKAAAGESGKDGEDSDESDEEEEEEKDKKKAAKAEKKKKDKEEEEEEEEKKKKKKDKMLQKQEEKKSMMAKETDDDSDEEESSGSESESDEGEKLGSANKAEMKAAKVPDDSGSESEEEEEDGSDGSSGDEEVTIPQATMEPQAREGAEGQPLMGQEDDSESEDESSSESESESDESGVDSDEEAAMGMKLVEVGEIKPLEA
ncbi:hypothetical protein VOLCADRAFT_106323 [Volvox carteri f. nagariensis]|uniref:Uncharacterized protein n=1 Tax=Volvox carteri f. nagariensis TaxID=3068 RepID=D8U6K3_VOLCA|nr:uncharacterized protein VOLCADRAFT_106323 [Volvox carteri f. nagariensis]EFJ44729.1 hypothetical protein VOLCADRAFT_106323 [Volvox carteri f. nagariensis]|eukprot:XP_002954305.1 hypothetical protein VOLCADRAFT_106323 [Volvox carteri f. nagariensis]